MANFGKIFPSSFADVLAKYADGDGATVSAHIDAAGGESTSVNLSISAQEIEEEGQTVQLTEANAQVDGVMISATGQATGENASTSLDLEVDPQEAVVEVTAKGEETATTATASADPITYPVFDVQQLTDDDANPMESFTSLTATWEALPILEGDSTLIETAAADALLL